MRPPEVGALGGGEAWGEAGGVSRDRRPRRMLSFCAVEVSVRSPLGRAHSATLSPFNQASCKAVISLFKYSPVGCSHIHNLMTLIMHISEKNRWHRLPESAADGPRFLRTINACFLVRYVKRAQDRRPANPP